MSAEPVRKDAPPGPATVLAWRPRREAHVPKQPDPNLTPTPEHRLAARLERTFADNGRSLTDPDTALDFTITLGIVIAALEALESTREQDKPQGEEERGKFDRLNNLLTGMLQAPRLLA